VATAGIHYINGIQVCKTTLYKLYIPKVGTKRGAVTTWSRNIFKKKVKKHWGMDNM
jgi:hypothetical protein